MLSLMQKNMTPMSQYYIFKIQIVELYSVFDSSIEIIGFESNIVDSSKSGLNSSTISEYGLDLAKR